MQLSLIHIWSSCSVGKTVRGNDPEGYPFTGTIERLEIYAGALPDEELALSLIHIAGWI